MTIPHKSSNSTRIYNRKVQIRLRTSSTPSMIGYVDLDSVDRYLSQMCIVLADPPQDEFGRLPKNAAREEIVEFNRLYDAGFEKWHVPRVLRNELNVALGRAGMSKRLLLSNAVIREQAAISWIDHVGDHWKASKGVRNRRWWFITFVGDCGNALEYAPVVALPELRAKVMAMLKSVGLHAVGFIEVQAITNFPNQGDGQTLMFHAHVIAWSDDPAFNHELAQQQLCADPALQHWLGARTVVFEPVPNIHRQLTWKAYYMLKPPVAGKYRVRNAETPSGFALKPTAIRKDLAVRMMECLSQLEWPDMVFAVGDGDAIRDGWLRDLNAWHQEMLAAGPGIMNDFDEVGMWVALRRGRRGIKRHPFVFAQSSGKQPSAWQQAAKASMDNIANTRRHKQRK